MNGGNVYHVSGNINQHSKWQSKGCIFPADSFFFFLIQLTNETLLGQLNGKPPGDLLQLIILQEEAEVQGKACQSCSISFKM